MVYFLKYFTITCFHGLGQQKQEELSYVYVHIDKPVLHYAAPTHARLPYKRALR